MDRWSGMDGRNRVGACRFLPDASCGGRWGGAGRGGRQRIFHRADRASSGGVLVLPWWDAGLITFIGMILG